MRPLHAPKIGSKYGLEDRDDWRYVVEHNEPLKQKLTTVINALNRGHSPRDAFEVGKEIKELLNRRDEINAPTNESFFGAPEEEAQRQMTELRDPSDKAMKELRDEKELKKLELEDEANEEEQAQLKKLIEKRDQEPRELKKFITENNTAEVFQKP